VVERSIREMLLPMILTFRQGHAPQVMPRQAHWASPCMSSAPSDDEDSIENILLALDTTEAATDGAQEAVAAETANLDVASLKQTLASLKQQDEQQWKDAFGDKATISDVDPVASEGPDDGFDDIVTF